MSKSIVSLTMFSLLLFSFVALTFGVSLSEVEGATDVKSNTIGSQWLAATGWNKTYGGTGSDYARSVVQTNDGGYALAGHTYSYGVGTPSSPNFWLVKTDLSGNVAWSKTYGGTGTDSAYSLIRTSDGGYALAGSTSSYGAGGGDMWLIKTDSSGNAQWNKTYGASNVDSAYSVVQTSDGGYAIAGYTASYGAGSGDMWLVRTASNGSMLWSKTYGGTRADSANCVIETSDGGFAIAGYTNWSDIIVGGNLWLVKTNSAGTAQWNKTYGGTNWDEARSVIQTSDGGYALAGSTRSFGAGLFDFWIVKTDSSGDIEWNKTFGGPSNEGAYSMVQTGDGGYAIAGGAVGDFWLVKTDSVGTMLWSRIFGGTGSEVAYSLIQTSDGGYALAGDTNSFGAGGYDFWLVKLTPATIYIRADGSVDPPTAPMQRNGDLYTLTDNIYTSAANGIVIQRNNMTLDGAGYTLQGSANDTGISLTGRSNVTIKNMRITAYDYGIWLASSSGNNVCGNNITSNNLGIYLYSSSNNSISGNKITNWYGIGLYSSNYNSVSGNNIANNNLGIVQHLSSNNKIFHNNFVNNTYHVNTFGSVNVWDDDYPSGGNYWSNYTGVDLNHDMIGDTPHVIDASNSDRYPLMGIFGAPTQTGENVTVFPSNDVGLIFENVTAAGFTTVNKTATGPPVPPAYKVVGEYYDIETTATYADKITLRFIYDDTGMPKLVEENLRLKYWNVTRGSWEDITTLVDTANNVIYGTTNHLSIFTTHSINTVTDPSITFLSATSSKTIIGRGFSATIDVALRNNGGIPKTFDLNVFADADVIGMQTVTNLAPGEQRVINFIWQVPLDFPKKNYTLIVDNLAGWAIVTMAGDVTGGGGTFPDTIPDGKVEIKDFAVMAKVYGVNYPDPRYVANYDIDGNGRIEIKDFSIGAKHYGKIDP